MIVVDTNVTVQLMIASINSDLAHRLFELDDAWILPPVWRHEFLNVMATYGKAGGMPIPRCISVWQTANAFFSNSIENINYEAALELAVRHNLSAYDSQFVHLAITHQISLVSEDRRLREKFPGLAFSLKEFVA
jgi:predicted nucleic acid-binding protein